jgi:DNA-binding NarL/FixJ family response regulator
MIRILLVDDHYMVRVGLASIVSLEKDMTVCAEASTGEQALQLFRSERPDVTLMDQRLPGMSGSETAAAMRREFTGAKIIIISTYTGDDEVRGALDAGALAYLPKSTQRPELLAAVRKVAQGEPHLPRELAARLSARQPRSSLSPRELEVMRLMMDGKRNKKIAAGLGISEGTVKIHVSSILAKLDAVDRTEAVTTALQRGILQLDP